MKVVLIGDSIRMNYQPLVAQTLTDADVWGPAVNCRHSLWSLDHFDEWIPPHEPDVIHVNFGIHDAITMADGEHQILLAQYRLCLQRFIAKVNDQLPDCRMIWATTTPLYTPCPETPMGDWPAREAADIPTYNAAALQIVGHANIPVNDLYATVMDHDFSRCLSEDGCHMTAFGNKVLADAVVAAIRALS